MITKSRAQFDNKINERIRGWSKGRAGLYLSAYLDPFAWAKSNFWGATETPTRGLTKYQLLILGGPGDAGGDRRREPDCFWARPPCSLLLRHHKAKRIIIHAIMDTHSKLRVLMHTSDENHNYRHLWGEQGRQEHRRSCKNARGLISSL